MKTTCFLLPAVSLLLLAGCASQQHADKFTGAEGEVKLITLDPGHFHAALVQKISYPQVSPEVYVYAPGGADLQEHLSRINDYNNRADDPTHWDEIVYTGDDFMQKMLDQKKGNVMVTAGNNLKKTEYIKRTLEAGINVLADKPMAINTPNFKVLEECFRIAQEKGVLLYDIMTERNEITTMLQKELSHMPELFGAFQTGTADEPAVYIESVHHFFKEVSGKPLTRPAWFYDVEQQGEGIVDVNTHLVDLVQWQCFPGVIIDYTKDIEMVDANRWPTPMTKEQFWRSTTQGEYPDFLSKDVRNDTLYVYANGDITYKIKGMYAKVAALWNYQAPEGTGDTHYAILRGTKANLVIRQGAEQNYRPELYIESLPGADAARFEEAARTAVAALAKDYPGVALKKAAEGSWNVEIPDSYRVGHEPHFAQVTENFLQYLVDGKLPDWEVPNMIAKYYVTTQGLDMARRKMGK